MGSKEEVNSGEAILFKGSTVPRFFSPLHLRRKKRVLAVRNSEIAGPVRACKKRTKRMCVQKHVSLWR